MHLIDILNENIDSKYLKKTVEVSKMFHGRGIWVLKRYIVMDGLLWYTDFLQGNVSMECTYKQQNGGSMQSQSNFRINGNETLAIGICCLLRT